MTPLDGSSVPLGELLARHLPALRVYVRLKMGASLKKQESESDVVQSVCRELLQGASEFEYRGEGKLRQWLYAAALNKIRQHARYHGAAKRDTNRMQRFPDQEELLSQAFGDVLSPSREAMANETREALETAFQTLHEDDREVILLRKVVGLTPEEIAEQMGRTVPSVRNLLNRALVRFAKLVDQD